MQPRFLLYGRALLPTFELFDRKINPIRITHLQGINFGPQPGKPGANIWPRRRRAPTEFAQLALATAILLHRAKALARGPRRRRSWRR